MIIFIICRSSFTFNNLEKELLALSKNIFKLDTEVITSYALYNLVVLFYGVAIHI